MKKREEVKLIINYKNDKDRLLRGGQMKSKHKAYIRLNIVSLFFIAVSFISVTLAWFAYSGIASVGTEIGVKAWNIEFQNGDKPVSNDIVISLSEIYPGMNAIDEQVKIKNSGDSDAQLKYSISSVRILDNQFTIDDNTDKKEIEDKLAHDYPFHINISLSNNYVLSGGDESMFDVSVSWPLDSGSDATDSTWGNDAYNFQDNEEKLKNADPEYNIRTSIKLEISVSAEQFIESNLASSDINYNLGDLVLYDVVNNTYCESISDNCIKTHVIDINNKIGDQVVSLLPDPYDTYSSGPFSNYDSILNYLRETKNWTATIRKLTAEDILRIISTDISNSWLIRSNISDSIIGNVEYGTRPSSEITSAIASNGYFKYNSQKFSYIASNKCYWTSSNYSDSLGFAFTKIDDNNAKLFGYDKSLDCSFIPVIIAPKTAIQP